MNKTQLTFSVLFSLVLSVALVSAIPGIPHAFWGDVTINGLPAVDGSSVIAKIEGIEVASTVTVGGVYGQDPTENFYITDEDNNKNGKTIVFYVEGVEAANFGFQNGLVSELNLAVTVETPEEDDGDDGGSSGGGSSGGGSSGGGSSSGSESVVQCEEKWRCEPWTDCTNEEQTRTCADANFCGTTTTKPETLRGCEIEIIEDAKETVDENPTTGFFGFTGAAIGAKQVITFGIYGIAIILAILGTYYIRTRTKSKNTKR